MRLFSYLCFVLQVSTVIILSGCTASNYTGFWGTSLNASPKAKGYPKERPPIELKNPEERIIVIYNHGTTNPRSIENCGTRWNKVPQSLLAIQNEKILIYYLCSRASELPSKSRAGEYIYGRLAEVEKTVDEFLALGVPAGNIFLAGHSAGGWVSLMAMRHFKEKFNAAIAFAPAFAGKRSEELQYPWWRREARPKQIREMMEATEFKALVFAYDGDPWNRPQDLQFLTDHFPETVRMIPYECDTFSKHLTHLNDCRQAETTKAISDYINDMVD